MKNSSNYFHRKPISMQHLCKYTLLAKFVDIIKQENCNLQKESFQIMALSDQIFAKQFNNEGIKYLNFFLLPGKLLSTGPSENKACRI